VTTNDGKRVWITGAGVVSPIGNTLQEFWDHLLQGVSGAGPITRFDTTAYDTRFACEVKGFTTEGALDRKEAKRMDRFVQYAVVAAQQAVRNSELDLEAIDRTRAGVIIGSGIGGMETFEEQHASLLQKGPRRVSPFFIPMMIIDMAAGQVSIQLGLKGPNFATVSACASGAHAIGEALRLIRAGDADVILAGGSEATITPMAVAGFSSARALSTRNDDPTRASRPFDSERDGFVIGEGAAVLVLEAEEHARRRGAQPYCELAGYGATGDAYHMTAPCVDGEGAARAMKRALEDAQMPSHDVQHINAHGTSTPAGDPAEVAAIKHVFGSHACRLMVSSTKSMTGHLLGGAGGLEAGITIMAIRDQIAPPTINLDNPSVETPIDLVAHKAKPMEINVALSNSFGFGGTNASVIFKKYA